VYATWHIHELKRCNDVLGLFVATESDKSGNGLLIKTPKCMKSPGKISDSVESHSQFEYFEAIE